MRMTDRSLQNKQEGKLLSVNTYCVLSTMCHSWPLVTQFVKQKHWDLNSGLISSKAYYLCTTQETMPFKKKKIEKTGGMRYFNIAMVLEGDRRQDKEEYKHLLS